MFSVFILFYVRGWVGRILKRKINYFILRLNEGKVVY